MADTIEQVTGAEEPVAQPQEEAQVDPPAAEPKAEATHEEPAPAPVAVEEAAAAVSEPAPASDAAEPPALDPVAIATELARARAAALAAQFTAGHAGGDIGGDNKRKYEFEEEDLAIKRMNNEVGDSHIIVIELSGLTNLRP